MTVVSFPEKVKPKVGEIIDVPGLGLMQVIKTYGEGSFCRDVLLGEKMDISKAWLMVKNFETQDHQNVSSAEEANFIQAGILHYRQRMIHAQVSVVVGIGFNSYTNGGKTQLLQYEAYAGETGSDLLWQLSDEGAEALIIAIYRQIIQPVFDHCSDPLHDGWLLDGLDAKIRNVAVTGDMRAGFKCTYVDLFSWKTSSMTPSGRVYSLEYPEPTDVLAIELGKIRSYYKPGIMMDFWMSLVRVKPEKADLYYQVMSKLAQEANSTHSLMEKVREYVQGNNLSVGRLALHQVKKLIADWGPKDAFKIRLFACALAFHRSTARALLPKVFGTTHFQEGPPTRIEEAKELLLQMCACPITSKRERSRVKSSTANV
ncbi:MAG: hypothetical protein WCV73_03410 [Patescibacteria group bacterium]|jgi:hypothetical protein